MKFYRIIVSSDLFEDDIFYLKTKPSQDQLLSILLASSSSTLKKEFKPKYLKTLDLTLKLEEKEPSLIYVEKINPWDHTDEFDFYIYVNEECSFFSPPKLEKYLTDKNSKIRETMKKRLNK